MQITPKNQANAIDAYSSTQVLKRQKPGIEDGLAYEQQGLKTDTVVISDTAKRIQEAQSKIQAIPDVRTEKVAELKARIENGTYEINADKIAGKMIRDSLINELLK